MPHNVGKYTHMLVMQKFSIQLGQGLDAALEFSQKNERGCSSVCVRMFPLATIFLALTIPIS